jgi:hypothetical protein
LIDETLNAATGIETSDLAPGLHRDPVGLFLDATGGFRQRPAVDGAVAAAFREEVTDSGA